MLISKITILVLWVKLLIPRESNWILMNKIPLKGEIIIGTHKKYFTVEEQ